MKSLFNRRNFITTLAVAGVLSTSGLSFAGYPEFEANCKVDSLRNKAWPHPFRGADAVSVVQPFELMKANGWKEFNTMADNYFDSENHLNSAGELKLRELLSLSPEKRRIVYVLKGNSNESTSARVQSVEESISALIPTGDLPPIYLTDVAPAASSGQYQTIVNRALIRTTPSPRLPAFRGVNAPSQNTIAPNASTPSGK